MKKISGVNTMDVDGHPAIIAYVPELGMFRGKFLGLSAYGDFMADSIQGLQKEGKISLVEYLEDCKENGIEPYAGDRIKTFTLRYPETFGERLAAAQLAINQPSLNAFVIDALEEKLNRI